MSGSASRAALPSPRTAPGAALVGCGRWGQRWLEALKAEPTVELRWVCDPQPQPLLGGVRWAQSIESALSDESVGVVVIATPTVSHFKLALTSVRHGRHVLVEKPMVTSSKELATLVSMAREQGCQLMVNHLLLYHPAIEALAKAVGAGLIGDVRGVWARRVSTLGGRDDCPWWTLAPHDLALIDRLVPTLLSGKVTLRRGGSQVTASIDAREHCAHLQFDTAGPSKVRLFVLAGTRGSLVFDDNCRQPLSWHASPLDRRFLQEAHSERELRSKLGFGEVLRCEGKPPLSLALSDFLCAVRERREPVAGSEHAARIIAALERGAPFASRLACGGIEDIA